MRAGDGGGRDREAPTKLMIVDEPHGACCQTIRTPGWHEEAVRTVGHVRDESTGGRRHDWQPERSRVHQSDWETFVPRGQDEDVEGRHQPPSVCADIRGTRTGHRGRGAVVRIE